MFSIILAQQNIIIYPISLTTIQNPLLYLKQTKLEFQGYLPNCSHLPLRTIYKWKLQN
jgi:hypothetical protein